MKVLRGHIIFNRDNLIVKLKIHWWFRLSNQLPCYPPSSYAFIVFFRVPQTYCRFFFLWIVVLCWSCFFIVIVIKKKCVCPWHLLSSLIFSRPRKARGCSIYTYLVYWFYKYFHKSSSFNYLKCCYSWNEWHNQLIN